MDLLDRLLITGEGSETPVSNIEDLLEVVGVICDREGGTGSTDIDPDLAGRKEGKHIEMDPRARVCSLPNTYTGGRGASSETIFNTIVPSLVVVGEDPAGRETGERCDEDREYAREVREANGTGGNFAIAIGKTSMSPFPVVGMRDKETPGFDKVGPDGLNNGVRGRRGPDKDKVRLS
jgi:hypothetical protein